MSSENFLFFKKLYEEYKKFSKDFLIENYRYWIGSKKLRRYELEEASKFRVETFFSFLDIIRFLYYYGDIIKVIRKYNDDVWFGYEILKFLLEKNLVKISGNKIIFIDSYGDFFIKPISELTILKKLRKSVKRKINLNKPLVYNFNPHSKFKWKSKYDQIPITTKSAIFILSKISYYFPARLNFAFVGDDDFLSVAFNLIFNSNTFSIDKDKFVISEIDKICSKFGAKVITLEHDIRKLKKIDTFYGCYTNPPYNISGSLKFVKFSTNLLSKDGGAIFLILGDDAIKRRGVFFQKEISNYGLILRELTPSIISYEFNPHHKEDVIIQKKMKSIGIKIEKKETMFAAFYVLEYVGKFRNFKLPSGIYSYV